MTNYDMTLGLVDKNFQRAELVHQTLSRLVNFALFTTTGTNGTAADVSQVLTIPAGFTVEDVTATIVTPSTSVPSVFGIQDHAAFVYLANTQSATAAAGTVVKTIGVASNFKDPTSATTLAASMTKFYSTATTLDVLIGATAPTNGVVKIDVRGYLTV
jgi:hypothetical protein